MFFVDDRSATTLHEKMNLDVFHAHMDFLWCHLSRQEARFARSHVKVRKYKSSGVS